MFVHPSLSHRSQSRRIVSAGALLAACWAAFGFVSPAPAAAATAKKAVAKKPPVVNQTKGQGQLNGGNGKFGVIYTLKSRINFQIISAAYQLTPFACYSKLYPRADEKLLVLTLAVKNVDPGDNYIGDFGGLISAFDDKGQKYDVGSGSLGLASLGDKEFSPTLKPGQGYGQAATNDPMRLALTVARDAHIVKLILNTGRAGLSEDVVRFYLSDATKDNAGEPGDPANVITPLPDGLRDPADKTGSVVPDELNGGKPGAGVVAYTGEVGVKLLSFTFLPEDTKLMGDNVAEEGKRFAIATLSIANTTSHEVSLFYSIDTGSTILTDSDGDRYNHWGTAKARTPEEADTSHVITPGQSYVVREVFQVPKSVQLVKYTFLAPSGHKWKFDISGVK